MKKVIVAMVCAVCMALMLTACKSDFSGDLSDLKSRLNDLEQQLVEQSTEEREKAYIGTFVSDWIDGQNEQKNISFKLTVNSDRTVVFESYTGTIKQFELSGTWVGNKSKDQYGILCLMESNPPYFITRTYFTLMQLDDGRYVIADKSAKNIFTSDGFNSSLVIFAKT